MMISVKDKVRKYNLTPKKHLSQNYIYDKKILRKFVESAGNIENKNILEIGPGPGTLTEVISEFKPKSLSVIEIDERFEKILRELNPDINLFIGDVLKLDLKDFIKDDTIIFSNLPYKISSQIMLKLFEYKPSMMILLFQKELADRLRSKSGNKSYGKITIFTSMFYDVMKILDLSPGSFYPAPNVTSTLLKFILKDNIPNIDFTKFNLLISEAFKCRRKQLKNALTGIILNPVEILESVGLNGNLRPESLTLDEYLAIYKRLEITNEDIS